MGHLWSTYGAPMEHLWSTCGAPLEHLGITQGALRERLGSALGAPRQRLRCLSVTSWNPTMVSWVVLRKYQNKIITCSSDKRTSLSTPGHEVPLQNLFIAWILCLVSMKTEPSNKTNIYPINLFDEQLCQGRCYKTFYPRNLRMLVISQSVGLRQAFPAQSNLCGYGQELTLEWST